MTENKKPEIQKPRAAERAKMTIWMGNNREKCASMTTTELQKTLEKELGLTLSLFAIKHQRQAIYPEMIVKRETKSGLDKGASVLYGRVKALREDVDVVKPKVDMLLKDMESHEKRITDIEAILKDLESLRKELGVVK